MGSTTLILKGGQKSRSAFMMTEVIEFLQHFYCISASCGRALPPVTDAHTTDVHFLIVDSC